MVGGLGPGPPVPSPKSGPMVCLCLITEPIEMPFGVLTRLGPIGTVY